MDSRPVPGEDRPEDPDDVDSRWAEIVAELGELDGFAEPTPGQDTPGTGPTHRPEAGAGPILPPPRRRSGDRPSDGSGRAGDPSSSGIGRTGDGPPGGADRGRGGRVIRPAGPDPGDEPPGPPPAAPGPRSWTVDPAVEEAEDHFVAPDPGPVLGGDPLLTLAWVAVVAVPLLVLLVTVVWRDVPVVILQIAGAAFLAGVGLLFWRMPRHKDHDDENGAVV
ncbi:hypothetical protein [Actinotalea sp.]|uniref:hypothetical protein n=1 Tax=Actinotalea sp. TaxID=1872145 RepID=UPI0035612FBE